MNLLKLSAPPLRVSALKIPFALLLVLPAYAAIDGVVVNRTTGRPQPGASVTISKMNAASGMLNNSAGSATERPARQVCLHRIGRWSHAPPRHLGWRYV